MMKQMYAITMSTGSYDDYNREIVFVTDDFEKGTAYVNEQNTLFDALEKKLSGFYQIMNEWTKDNPRPEQSGFNLHPIPKWRGDQTITQEMRDERQAITLQNQIITQKANEPITNWSENYKEFVNNWLKTNLTLEELVLRENHNDNRWDIEPVKWL